jgi:hypothetical protein
MLPFAAPNKLRRESTPWKTRGGAKCPADHLGMPAKINRGLRRKKFEIVNVLAQNIFHTAHFIFAGSLVPALRPMAVRIEPPAETLMPAADYADN